MNPKNLFRQTVLLGFGALVAVHTASAQSWTTQYNGGRYVFGIKAVDENTVWAAASSGAFFRTIDGGKTWTDSFIPGSAGVGFFAVAPIDQNTAYLAGANRSGADGRIYKTSDGGQTWTQQYRNTKPGVLFIGIAFWDKDNGIAVSDPVEGSFLILTTTNGGATWQEVPKANIPSPLAGEFVSFYGNGSGLAVEGASNAWFGTSRARPVRVLRTRDKGRTWTVANTPLPTSGTFWGVTTLAFIDSLNGYVGGVGGTSVRNLMRTTDGGKTWSVIFSYTEQSPINIVYVPKTGPLGLIVNAENGSFYSQDGGIIWKKISSDYYDGLTFASPTAGWATGGQTSSLIAKFNGNLATAVAERQFDMPQVFELAQNYPNPFNPETVIEYRLPRPNHVKLLVYNLAGQLVRILFDAQQSNGHFQIKWDGKDELGNSVASGVYLYQLHAGSFSETKKIILMR